MKRSCFKNLLANRLRLMAIAACVYCLVSPAGPTNKCLADDGRRPVESEKEESQKKTDPADQESTVLRPRELRSVELSRSNACCLVTPCRKPLALARTARFFHPIPHADRDLRNGIGSPLLT